jgi:hypothetical protein
MRTFLYNLDTQERGAFRNGPYLVDGKPGVLPPNMVEITVVEEDSPNFDYGTQQIVRSEELDLASKEFRITYRVVDLTPEQIEARKPRWDECTPLQLRLAMLEFGLDPDGISLMIDSMTDQLEKKKAFIAWEYAVTIKKNHYLVQYFAAELRLTPAQVDEIFEFANTID